MLKRLVCIRNLDTGKYISIGNIYDVTIRENGNALFINDFGVSDIFSGVSLYNYFIDIEVYRNNLIDDILR